MIARLSPSTSRVPMYALMSVLTIGLVVGLAGCGGSTDQPAQQDEQQQEEQTEPESQDETPSEEQQPDEDEGSEQQEQPDSSDEADGEMSLVEEGQQVAQSTGCLGCHSTDGSDNVGPTWQGAYGHDVTLESGETIVADEDYLRESIRNPGAKIVEGFPSSMPNYGESRISEDDLQALIAYIKSLSEASEEGSADE